MDGPPRAPSVLRDRTPRRRSQPGDGAPHSLLKYHPRALRHESGEAHRVPVQLGAVVEDRVRPEPGDRPLANRQRVVLASDSDGSLQEVSAVCTDSAEGSEALRYGDDN